ncbi:hypothetical protein MEQU1_002456 [Malassezia equina]|uniref:PITH domain-containing protein n=1 Tax=Malassezia equina TaxID=1381935 RepID=A0AAF0EKH3_9BASI|nr:hypothetical protein MEQU1_002456 [Malassezia equina]
MTNDASPRHTDSMQCDGESTSQDRTAVAAAGAGDNSNLHNYIDHVHVWGTNIEPPESAKHALKPWDQRHSLETWVESGVDDQMIINIPFTCPVRIQSILLYTRPSDLAVRSDSLAGTSSRMYYIGFLGKALDPRSDSTHQHDVPAATTSTHEVDAVGNTYGAAATPSVR